MEEDEAVELLRVSESRVDTGSGQVPAPDPNFFIYFGSESCALI